MKPVLLPLLACLPALAFAATDGALDPTFGSNGRATVAFDLGGSKADSAAGSVLQPDGKLVVVGAATNANGDRDFAITRLLPNGLLDTTFASNGKQTVGFDLPGGYRNDAACCVQLLSDGRIVVAGTIDLGSTGTTSAAVAVLLPSGDLDTSVFGGTGKYTYAVNSTDPTTSAADLRVIESSTDTEIVAVGASGSSQAWVLRLHLANSIQATGTVLPVHNAAGVHTGATAMAMLPGGQVVLIGNFVDYNNPGADQNCFIARFVDANFALDPAFGTNGILDFDSGLDDTCAGATITHDGNIVFVGSLENFTEGWPQGFVTDVLADGSAVAWSTAFGFEGLGTGWENYPTSVQLQSDGRIVVAGPESGGNFAVARFRPDGTLDNTFMGSEPGSAPGTSIVGFPPYGGSAFALSVDANDRVYVSGTVPPAGSDSNIGVVRLLSDKVFGDGFEGSP